MGTILRENRGRENEVGSSMYDRKKSLKYGPIAWATRPWPRPSVCINAYYPPTTFRPRSEPRCARHDQDVHVSPKTRWVQAPLSTLLITHQPLSLPAATFGDTHLFLLDQNAFGITLDVINGQFTEQAATLRRHRWKNKPDAPGLF